MRKVIIVLLIALVLFGCPSNTGKNNSAINKSAMEPKIKMLFIGNSYTYVNNLPSLLTQLAASTGKPKTLETQMVAVGGATLQSHWENAQALEVLKHGSWNYVVLQEQSMLPIIEPLTMYQYATLFDAEIKKAGANTVFFLTWARQNTPETQRNLTDAYMSITRQLDAIVAPVGIAWQKAREEDSNIIFYEADGSHSNLLGSYMAACVFYAILYDESPVGSTSYSSIGISDSQASFIQRIAWQTVESVTVGQ